MYIRDLDKLILTRRVGEHPKKKKIDTSKPRYKYRIQLPHTVKEAIHLDKKNQKTLQAHAIKKEIQALVNTDCFGFKEKGYIPNSSYQKDKTLTCISCEAGSIA